jgi:phosphatidylglycerophosphatase C
VSRQVVAAFDFDGTLTDGGSVWPYLSAMVGRGKVLRAGIILFPRLVRAALFGGTAADVAKQALFTRTLAGLPADALRARSAAFGLAHYRRHARTDVRARLEWHRRQGHRVVVVSASPEYYVGVIGDELGADAVLATRLETGSDGRLTGRYDGRNCRGEQKVARLRAWIDEHVREGEGEGDGDGDDSAPYLWAYGNSAGDRRLLAAADTGVDVGRLGRFGKLRAFPRLAEVTAAERTG